MSQEEEDRQRRGAYAAGYEAGFKAGRESLYREGWERITDYRSINEGDVIKLMVPTISGWKGEARVIFANPGTIHAQRCDMLCEGFGGTIDCCLHECLVKRVYGDDETE